uniref:Small ribosomal subunit protein uS10m n=1 Tax=Sinocyclocheilus grahami TaxID=75366 RepID=A0A672MRL3_SINGR
PLYINVSVCVCRTLIVSQVSLAEEPDALYQKLTVRVKGHDRSVLDSYEFFVTLAAGELGLKCEPPKHTDKLALLKSVHIFKKHHVQYETRTHQRRIEVSRVTGSSARVYLEYIQRNLPEGVAMEVIKVTKIPEHIHTPGVFLFLCAETRSVNHQS